jgi:hypothetical protein
MERSAPDARRLRLDSCLSVIRDLSSLLSEDGAHHRIVEQLARLDEMLSLIDTGAVDDQDLERIEGSTNQLFQEIAVLFNREDLGSLYDETSH